MVIVPWFFSLEKLQQRGEKMRRQKMWLLILNITFNMVMGFILPVNMVFINKNLHEPLTTAGFALMVYSLFMMIGNALGGVLFDKTSRRWTLQSGYFIAVLTLIGMSFHHVWPSYIFMLVMLGFGMGISYTAINAYTAYIAEQSVGDSRIFFNNMYLAANVGIAIGSTAVSFIFNASIFLTFFIPVLMFVSCIIIVFFKADLFDETNEQANESHDHYNDDQPADPKIEIGDRRFRLNLIILSGAIFMMWMGYTQWDSNMSVYMLSRGMTMKQFGLIFTINATSLLIIQPIMNRVMSKLFKLLKNQIMIGITIMGLSFLLLPNAKSYLTFVTSMLILTVGEAMVFPTIPALLNKMSTNKNRGSLQSLYSIFGSLGRAVGPYVGSLLATWLTFGHLFYGITVMMIIIAVSLQSVKELNK